MTGRYKAYPEYKDSGVEWLGSVPKHWSVIPLKHLATLNPKKSDVHKSKMHQYCSFVPMEKLKLGSINLDEKKLISEVYDGYNYFENEDVLLAKVTPCFENKNMAIAKKLINGLGFGSSEIYVLRATPKLNNHFLFYRLQEDGFMEIATAAMSGAGGLKRVPAETITAFSAAFPMYAEQQKIASFLDHETAKIDTLIAKQEKLIELLKEKRQAVISHAVTKGLNPDVPMKDSGVEWLGEVPEHWVSAPLKRFIKKMEQGKSPECESSPATSEQWGVLKTSCVNNAVFNSNENKALPAHIVPHKQYEVLAGDILMSRASGSVNLIGSVARVQSDVRSKILLSDKIFRLILTSKVDPNYFIYLMSSSYVRKLVESAISGAEGMANNITKSAIMDFLVPMPDLQEQKFIVKEIKQKLNTFDLLIAKSQQASDLGRKRKTALISAAVTGKIDVRDWQPQGVQG